MAIEPLTNREKTQLASAKAVTGLFNTICRMAGKAKAREIKTIKGPRTIYRNMYSVWVSTKPDGSINEYYITKKETDPVLKIRGEELDRLYAKR